VKQLLQGSVEIDGQAPLFLWAYDFGAIPTSLISTMYEIFYQEDVAGKITGTHYTPAELVEYVLSRVLTSERLDTSPTVCDPACGSGLFLVEAYRRIVRHEMARRGRALSAQQLKNILLRRIAGIDVNEEAVRLAAFSLYLAYLNLQSPQDIRQAGAMPRLISRSADPDRPLTISNAFAPSRSRRKISDGDRELPWPEGYFDVVVGNPPWTEPAAGESPMPRAWVRERGLPVGDNNPSQQFLWRALALLKPRGTAALLVASSAFLSSRATSKRFRSTWLSSVRLDFVVNFVQARRLFFESGVAPFLLVGFTNDRGRESHEVVVYESVVPTRILSRTRSMAFGRMDRRVVTQEALQARDYLWKVYGWGTQHDDALMSRLDMESRLDEAIDPKNPPGWGYQPGSDPTPKDLQALRSLKTFEPWGPIQAAWLEERPEGVKRQPHAGLYRGRRILVKNGIRPSFGPISRLEEEPLSFRHVIYGIPMSHRPQWQSYVVAGILLSSLGRYRLFMTSPSWGVWHDKINADEILALPIRLNREHLATRRVVAAVKALKSIRPLKTEAPSLFDPTHQGSEPRRDGTLERLDHAVFDLFDLPCRDRDLVLASVVTNAGHRVENEFFSAAASFGPVFGLAIFIELALLMRGVMEEQGQTAANTRTVQSVVRANVGLMVATEAAALIALACDTASTFLVGAVLVPPMIQLYLLVDITYLKVGVTRISPG